MMKDQNEKITSAQAIANDIIAEISAMINQDNVTKEYLKKLKERVHELSDMLNSIKTDKMDF